MTTSERDLPRTAVRPGTVAVALAGELDLHTVLRIEPALTGLAGGLRDDLRIDLGGVTFCDSSGVGLFLRLQERCAAAGVRLILCRIPRRPARVIRALGVDRTLPCAFA